MATQVVIAGSDPVLSRALPHISPALSSEALRSEIQVSSQTSNILAISATARTAGSAEAAANAVAKSYIDYVTSPASPVGRTSANMLQPAMTATGPSQAKRMATYAVIGAILGALIGVIAAFVRSRSDRRLKELDEIANSIGVPVLASFPVAHPTTPAGWTKLLEEYQPSAVHALRLRQALEQLAVSTNGYRVGSSLAVLSLSSDPRAVAIGPQLAIFAASLGIPTALIIDPQGEAIPTAGLRVACSVPPPASSSRLSQLRVSDSVAADRPLDAALTVAVVVVDEQNSQVAETLRTTATVLGVSSGAVTAEQLASAAASAAADGRHITGILVADPEPTDRTMGRIQPTRPVQRRIPGRLKNTTEMRKTEKDGKEHDQGLPASSLDPRHASEGAR
jgi:hypothetical protein